MDDLISRNAAILIVERYGCNNGSALGKHSGVTDCIASEIAALQAADTVPVVHGRWIDHKDEHQCSACKEFTVVDAYAWIQLQYDFCPYCGAKMDGERRDDNALSGC